MNDGLVAAIGIGGRPFRSLESRLPRQVLIMKYGEHWEEEIGTVTHYYNDLHVAAIHVDHGRLHVGDKLHIRGHTTDMETTIENMQVNHHEVTEVGKGAYVGIPVDAKVREHDHVYLVH